MSKYIDRSDFKVPSVVFKMRKDGEFYDLSSTDIFENKTVVLFALPGAFTPTCSTKQLPGYREKLKEFKNLRVDTIACLSVNDAFVMNAWRDVKGDENEDILFLPDGNCYFTSNMGMTVDRSELGFGIRSWRYSMLVEDGVITKMFIEPEVEGDPFEVSDADTMINYIRDKRQHNL